MGNLNEKFISETVACDSLDVAIEWISNNVSVDDVFDKDVIIEWISNNVSVDDVFDKDVIKEYITENFSIEEIFPDTYTKGNC